MLDKKIFYIVVLEWKIDFVFCIMWEKILLFINSLLGCLIVYGKILYWFYYYYYYDYYNDDDDYYLL